MMLLACCSIFNIVIQILTDFKNQGEEDQALQKRAESKKAAAKKRAARRSALITRLWLV